MTSKERVIKCLNFDNPDRIPVDLWTLPGTVSRLGESVTSLSDKVDFAGIDVDDPTNDPRQYLKGTYTDAWGCGWHNAQGGIIGEVKEHPLADDSKIDSYKAPKDLWSDSCYKNTAESYKSRQDKFIITGHYNLFERMQFLRGTENLYMDIAEENNEFFRIRDIVSDYYFTLLDRILKYDFDALALFDDWGSQRATLISPDSWKRLFKPVYKEMIDRAKAKGKYVFFSQ